MLEISSDHLEKLRSLSIITAIDSHTAGDPTRMVILGETKVPGKSMREKKKWLERKWRKMRESLMREPRGYNDMEGAILTEPISQKADIGVIFMSPDAFWDMCGTGTIGVVTTLIELGVIEVKGENVNVKLDTPAGLVSTTAKVRDGKVKEVRVINVPSFYCRTISVLLPERGMVDVDIAYGGEFYAIVEARKLGLTLKKQNSDEIVKLSLKIMEIMRENQNQKILHPSGEEKLVDSVRVIEKQGDIARSVTVPPEGMIFRSPCGTGTSAHMALKYAKGEISLGEEVIHRSIIDTEFRSRLIEKKNLWGMETVIPEITGSAWITGVHEFIINPDDPLGNGFKL